MLLRALAARPACSSSSTGGVWRHLPQPAPAHLGSWRAAAAAPLLQPLHSDSRRCWHPSARRQPAARQFSSSSTSSSNGGGSSSAGHASSSGSSSREPLRPPREPDPSECCGRGCAQCVWTAYHADLREFQLAEAALLGVSAPVDPFEAMEARLAGGRQQVQAQQQQAQQPQAQQPQAQQPQAQQQQAQQQQAQQQPLLQQDCLEELPQPEPKPERQASGALPADRRQRGSDAGAAAAVAATAVSGGAGRT